MQELKLKLKINQSVDIYSEGMYVLCPADNDLYLVMDPLAYRAHRALQSFLTLIINILYRHIAILHIYYHHVCTNTVCIYFNPYIAIYHIPFVHLSLIAALTVLMFITHLMLVYNYVYAA